MGFLHDPATLERFEWPRLLARLATQASTARGAEVCRRGEFAPDLESVRALLRETTEARRILDAEEDLPLGGISDLRPLLAGAARGQQQPTTELLGVLRTARAARQVATFLRERGERAPALAAVAADLPDLRALEGALERAITPEGELREDASPELRRTIRRIRDLEAEVERRMERKLRDPAIVPHLQDNYATTREGRPVLPLRADSHARVPGIVHDSSSSGTTVFVEPADVVEVGNRLRIARRDREREIERILAELLERVRADLDPLEETGRILEGLDAAMARGRLSHRLDAIEPSVGPDLPLALRLLVHPLLLLEGGLPSGSVVPNDIALPEGVQALLVSGPNAGGKTVVAKAVGLAALSARAGLHVTCGAGSTLPLFDAVFADIGDEQDLRAGLSTFSARMTNLAEIVRRSGPRSLVVLDEVGEGTEPGEGAALAQALLEALVDRGATVVATTHFNRLKELGGEDGRFLNASAEFDRETLKPTYRVHLGVPGSSGAAWVAERVGVSPEIVERARTLLDGEDRKLEALTRGLSELRQELEAERRVATQVREETEQVRDEYEARLASLRAAREKALASMKDELEQAFRSARTEIADVVRELQRGKSSQGRAANEARDALARVRRRTQEVERVHPTEPASPRPPIDWRRVDVGSRLEVSGIPGEAVLVRGPGRKDEVVVRMGGIKMTLPESRVLRTLGPPEPRPRVGHVDVVRSPESEGLQEACDLRGLRVDEALERADAHLQRALGTSLSRVLFIHGHGTGALRAAIREWLRDSPFIATSEPAGPHEGGNGVTVATLR
ncbi:MAG: Smr/MutS family protein [Myxococcota bacterium]